MLIDVLVRSCVEKLVLKDGSRYVGRGLLESLFLF